MNSDNTKPFFMMDETWYTYDEKSDVFELTDKAPHEAVISFQAYNEYSEIEDDFYTMIFGTEEEKQENERIKMELDFLISQPEASQKYDEEQQARKLYGV